LIPDSAAHIAYARSLLWDADLDFTNDYQRLGSIESEPGIAFGALTEAGRPGNPFGIGSAVLWLPFVAIVAVLGFAASAAGFNVATDGFGTSILLAVHMGTWTYVAAALLLIVLILRETLPGGGKRAAVFGAFFGTPLIYFVLQMPSYSHACSAFVVTLLLYLSLRWRSEWTNRRAVMLGLVLGLAGLVRVQELGFWFIPLIIGWYGGAMRQRKDVLQAGIYTGAALVVFAIQLAAWSVIYGSVFQIPQGSGFLQFSIDRLWNVLFAARHGLIAWSPVIALAAAGWVMLIRRRDTRALGLAAIVGFVIQWFVNSLPIDWWGGWSFGARRFVDCVPLVAVGLAAVDARGRAWRAAVYALASLNLVQWLRVASGSLSGETDPGWNMLWGKGFFSFLPHIPTALWRVLEVPWTYVRALHRPTAIPPSLHPDSDGFMALIFVLWSLGLVFAAFRIGLRLQNGESRPDR
ncbi:MAG: hypothetical protein JSW50_02800, partial [Candidatus Latescibacterota bacterium]